MFFIGESNKIGFVYVFFLLVKRFYMTATMTFTDGKVNAILSLAMQSLDSTLLIFLRPFNDGQLTCNEVLAGLSTVTAYVAISLPILIGPDMYVGDATAILLASAGVLVSALTSLVESLARIFQGLQGAVGIIGDIVNGEIVAEAAGIVGDGVQGALEEAAEEPAVAATAAVAARGKENASRVEGHRKHVACNMMSELISLAGKHARLA